jgi:hypothetical protein
MILAKIKYLIDDLTSGKFALTNPKVVVYGLAYNGDIVAFKMGRRQGARRAHI